jgi:oligopeptide/dipeptide ABC transporter ATP-binding protein
LDVMVQAQVLALLRDLVRERAAGMLLISHDLSVLAEMCDRAAVMYAGRIVEQAPVEQIFDAPAHPYTQGLLQTRRDLRTGAAGTPLFQIPGSPPTPGTEPPGCPFAPRCTRATQVCTDTDPPLEPVSADPVSADPVSADHRAACHHPGAADTPADVPTRAPAASGPGGAGERP